MSIFNFKFLGRANAQDSKHPEVFREIHNLRRIVPAEKKAKMNLESFQPHYSANCIYAQLAEDTGIRGELCYEEDAREFKVKATGDSIYNRRKWENTPLEDYLCDNKLNEALCNNIFLFIKGEVNELKELV